MRTHRALIVAAITLVACTSAWADGQRLGEADLIGDEISRTAHVATAQTHALFRDGDLYLSANEIEVTFTDGAPVVTAQADGNAKMSFADLYAAADVIRYDVSGRTVVLTGQVTVFRRSQRLAGERAEVNLENRAIRLETAHGWVQLPTVR
jgi:lipopolysaccharide export system protein LptA